MLTLWPLYRVFVFNDLMTNPRKISLWHSLVELHDEVSGNFNSLHDFGIDYWATHDFCSAMPAEQTAISDLQKTPMTLLIYAFRASLARCVCQ